ncbi:uncharacterized protein EI97DRAFT_472625 [Westerdykella ornata]|uniref:PH domain-containing protein n=1 Tax=Westerdykella ornata TaxID=318751 RepID=A0A6A6JYJ4_WESOR|nr:uncharacterized protein EI97DRAFT_472625 [Westerdykella ornata]KAF2281294.1 hypothetical protein EI97DRAFT_472625 [Westerdykella ornata]
MVRPNRVLSFMSEWGGSRSPHRKTASQNGLSQSPAAPASPMAKQSPPQASTTPDHSLSSTAVDNAETPPHSPSWQQPKSESRLSSRPMSMIQTYHPPVMEVSQDTLPELQRIFTFLNSHSNKLYQEGYFLKFHDTDERGRPAQDRVWQECFAQLVGTILSLWDASELDQSNGNAEVFPTFINLTDAAIHMMPSMVLNDGKKLDNVLSVSTAASNKYLFHFNSFNSLTQWTAGIRLAMYEHTTLQEAYTGALIAGKGKSLNNIRIILDRQRAKHEDWARVRFGAGTPWRRCWCVVSPPDAKEYAKLQKAQKKTKPYNRSPLVLKGDIKFYDTKKITKKTRPIATVTDAYSCYAIYPQSKPLIDQSTLVKIEGKITVHGTTDTTTEGFVFVMPESHAAVSGFEMMLRFLFPVFDTFALYGRPNKLIADVLDTRGLMFAMPPDRRYGYLEMWDVVGLIHTEGSQNWSERQWRKQLKELTAKRMLSAPSRTSSRTTTYSRRNNLSRTSLPPSRAGTLRFEERGSINSQPPTRQPSPSRNESERGPPQRMETAPPSTTPKHQRSVSEAIGYRKYQADTPSRLSYELNADSPPPPPEHRELHYQLENQGHYGPSYGSAPAPALPVGPVASPPSFTHAPGQRPSVPPYQPPSTMRPHAQIDSTTLDQLADATNTPIPAGIAAAGAAAAWRSRDTARRSGEFESNGSQVYPTPNGRGYSADQYANASRSGHSGNRLPTIPASPYIEQPEFTESPTTFHPTAPPVPEHAELSMSHPPLTHRSHPGSTDGADVIHRKPVPGRSSALSPNGDGDNYSTKSSSIGSLRNAVIHPDDLDRLETLPDTPQPLSRSDEDNISTSTPDYASTHSEEIQSRTLPERRDERPRSVFLKKVGDPSLNPKPEVVVGDAHYSPETRQQDTTEIPTIDFGPTYSLDPAGKRPGTSGTLTQGMFSKSKENLAPSPRETATPPGRTTPNAAMHLRQLSGSSQTNEERTIAWQPGLAFQPAPPKPKMDPEEWVAQRAAAAAARPGTSPLYAHGRSKSHTPPPMNRARSGDWAHLQRTPEDMPARPPSRPLSRPQSRGALNLLDQRPVSLSAHEQEQVARLTGTPLIDMTHARTKSQPATEGLTAYIDQRERQKAHAKANHSTAAMQAEIDRRMMAAQQRQMLEMQQMGQQVAMAQGGYGAPTMGFSPQAYSPGLTYSPGMTPPAMFPQQGYYQAPVSPAMPPAWGTPSPQPMQASYFPAQQQQPVQQRYPSPQPQQQPFIQPYGASFDQAQAAARYAHQQGQQFRGA